MKTSLIRLATITLAAAVTLGAAACSNEPVPTPTPTTASAIKVTDNNGEHDVSIPPKAVSVTDNRVFQTLADWGIEPVAAPITLIPSTVKFANQDSIADLGSHTAPTLETIVVANPDLIINGQRFTQHAEKLAEYAPDAVLLNFDPRDGEPLDSELKRATSALGEIFGKQSEAKKLSDELDKALARVIKAYNPNDTVMAINSSGGKIGYIAPTKGRTLGPIFDLVGLTPALTVDGASDNHKGDEINAEAIAASNPTWILVLDRDAAFGEADYVPAAKVIENTPELANVTAIKEGNIVYMPADTYVNESIQTYTKFLNDFADALEAAK